MARGADELVFLPLPLGGVGEIGMNASLYGFGPKENRRWLLVDCGVSFAGDDLPGIDLIIPTSASSRTSARTSRASSSPTRTRTTHRRAHRAVATPARPGLRDAVRRRPARHPPDAGAGRDQGADDRRRPRSRVQMGPFDVEFVAMAHSIPESTALAIRTPVGTVLHSGDWKIDPTPGIGWTTDEKRLAEIGEEGVLASSAIPPTSCVTASAPARRMSPRRLKQLVAAAPGRVAVTTFASNVARMRAVCEAAAANGREVVAIAGPWTASSRSRPSSGTWMGCRPCAARRPMAISPATKSWRC